MSSRQRKLFYISIADKLFVFKKVVKHCTERRISHQPGQHLRCLHPSLPPPWIRPELPGSSHLCPLRAQQLRGMEGKARACAEATPAPAKVTKPQV